MSVQPHRLHPDVHAPWAEWSEDQTLHIAVCYSNPFRRRTIRELANDCIRHLRHTPNVRLYVGELAYGDRPHEVTSPGIANGLDQFGVKNIQLRTNHELFHKENILNRVVQEFPEGYSYGGYWDADFVHSRHDWAIEGIHQLQHYDFVQPFSTYTDLGDGNYGSANVPMRVNSSFAYNYVRNGYQLPEGYTNGGWRKPGFSEDSYYGAGARGGVGATGGMWLWRKSAFDTVGRLWDQGILGHGDWFMTFGLVGEEAPDMHIDGYHPDYRNSILAWQRDASRIKKNIGYVDGHAIHQFHGSKVKRAYSSRDLILVKHQFSPLTDIKKDWQGIYQLTPDKPALRDAIRAYFLSRNEDDPNLYGSENPIA